MKVHGVVVPVAALEEGKRLMARRSRFAAHEVETAIRRKLIEDSMDVGTAGDVAFRAADRLLQQERKAGRIVFISGSWRNVGEG